jgi:hypothetical protein
VAIENTVSRWRPAVIKLFNRKQEALFFSLRDWTKHLETCPPSPKKTTTRRASYSISESEWRIFSKYVYHHKNSTQLCSLAAKTHRKNSGRNTSWGKKAKQKRTCKQNERRISSRMQLARGIDIERGITVDVLFSQRSEPRWWQQQLAGRTGGRCSLYKGGRRGEAKEERAW